MPDADIAVNQGLRLIACLRPFPLELIDRWVPAGGSIADILREAGLDPGPLNARVCLDDVRIKKANWGKVRPKAGRRLTVGVIPTGGGGTKDTLNIVASLLFPPYGAYYGYQAQNILSPPGGKRLAAGIGVAGPYGPTVAAFHDALIPPPRL